MRCWHEIARNYRKIAEHSAHRPVRGGRLLVGRVALHHTYPLNYTSSIAAGWIDWTGRTVVDVAATRGTFQSNYMSVCLPVRLSLCLNGCRSAGLSTRLCLTQFVFILLCLCVSVRRLVCRYVCPYLSLHRHTPPSRSCFGRPFTIQHNSTISLNFEYVFKCRRSYVTLSAGCINVICQPDVLV